MTSSLFGPSVYYHKTQPKSKSIVRSIIVLNDPIIDDNFYSLYCKYLWILYCRYSTVKGYIADIAQ